MNSSKFNRTDGDLGNIVALEHINVEIPDQRLATIFYTMGLGLTRDPYLFTGIGNMWINIGRNQIHSPTGAPMVLRGVVKLVMPEREALIARLESVQGLLSGTRFQYVVHDDHVFAMCPWGNRFQIVEPGAHTGRMRLGIAEIRLDVRPQTTRGIADFYATLIGAQARHQVSEQGACAEVTVGQDQRLVFAETEAEIPPYDKHHVQIYVADFSGPHAALLSRGLISQEDDDFQYRFRKIVDPQTSEVLAEIEHEVRSLRHPLYARPLINRNPAMTNRNYVAGQQDFR